MSDCVRCGDPLDGALRCPRCGARNTRPAGAEGPIGGFPVLVEKKTSEHEVARFGPVTAPLSSISAGRPLTRWVLIIVTVGLLLIFLILTLMKDPLRIFREEPPGLNRGGAAQAVPAIPDASGPSLETPSLGPVATLLPPKDLRLSLRHPEPEMIPPLPVQGLADGKPPVCWIPRDEDESLVVDAGAERSWSHLLLYRCSLPSVGTVTPGELTIEVHIPGQARSRLLRLRNEEAPTRVDLGGLLSDQLILTLRPIHTAAGLSGVVGYHFEDQEQ